MIDFKKIYLRIFLPYHKILEKVVVSDCDSLLDVGCGNFSPIRYFSDRIFSVGVDAFLPSINDSKKHGIHNEYCNIDVLDIDKYFKNDSFDCVLASDLIEHLCKEDGNKLINMMEKIAKKKVVIFTPNGFLPQGEYGNNPMQVHKSGWTKEEMEMRGYKIMGVNGWKPLKGKYASIKFRPKLFWTFISDISQLFVRNRPEKAFQILCIKTEK